MVRAAAWTVLVLGALFALGSVVGLVGEIDEAQGGQVTSRLVLLGIVAVAMVRAARKLRPAKQG